MQYICRIESPKWIDCHTFTVECTTMLLNCVECLTIMACRNGIVAQSITKFLSIFTIVAQSITKFLSRLSHNQYLCTFYDILMVLLPHLCTFYDMFYYHALCSTLHLLYILYNTTIQKYVYVVLKVRNGSIVIHSPLNVRQCC